MCVRERERDREREREIESEREREREREREEKGEINREKGRYIKLDLLTTHSFLISIR